MGHQVAVGSVPCNGMELEEVVQAAQTVAVCRSQQANWVELQQAQCLGLLVRSSTVPADGIRPLSLPAMYRALSGSGHKDDGDEAQGTLSVQLECFGSTVSAKK